jgi:hypothetical protein
MSIDMAADLDTALERYAHVPGLVEHIRGACGGEPGAGIAGQAYILAYLIRQTDEVFSVYVLTERSFIVAEMARSGETLAVWLDSQRISRIAEVVAGGERIVTVEIDGDIRRIEARMVEAGETKDGGTVMEGRFEGRIVPAAYELRGAIEERELAWFTMQLRRQDR